MQQMQWREELDDAQGMDDLEKIQRQVKQAGREVLQNLERLMDTQQAYAEAVGQVRAMMFIERFAQDVDNRLDQIET
jgi:molecular chaperone HscB